MLLPVVRIVSTGLHAVVRMVELGVFRGVTEGFIVLG